MAAPKFSYTRSEKDGIVTYRFKNVENHRGELYASGFAQVPKRNDHCFNPCVGFKSLQNMYVADYVKLEGKVVKDLRIVRTKARRPS